MDVNQWKKPVVLTGRTVRLEPLQIAHIPGLIDAGKEKRIWQYMLYGDLTVPENMAKWVDSMLIKQKEGTDLPFAVIHSANGEVAGATRYMDMRPEHRGLEIGGTWYAIKYQQTGVNTECKYLLLKYAFEVLKCIRVQFKVDAVNKKSVRAIERLGAVREGVLRSQFLLPDGRKRNSIYFSILDGEWRQVKENLEKKLAYS